MEHAGTRGNGPPPPLPDPPAHYSPMKLTQYDKDVAIFKGPEPPSQVSSSTDSGYGHAHIYERMPGDMTGNFSSKFCIFWNVIDIVFSDSTTLNSLKPVFRYNLKKSKILIRRKKFYRSCTALDKVPHWSFC